MTQHEIYEEKGFHTTSIISEHQTPTDNIDVIRSHLRERGQNILQARTFDQALNELSATIELLGMSYIGWSPDVANPYFDKHMDQFLRLHNWPEDLILYWWKGAIQSKMPLYRRCHFEHLPFSINNQLPNYIIKRQSPEVRFICEISSKMGIRSLLNVPVRLPYGQVSLISWGGYRKKDELKWMEVNLAGELLLIGHFFLDKYLESCQVIRARIDQGKEISQSRLTLREMDCLRLVAQGYRDTEIGRIAGLSPLTVRYYIDRAVEKLAASNRSNAVAIALQLGLLGPIAL